MNIRENYTTQNENAGENEENSLSEAEEQISDKHNQIMFYRDEKQKNLNFESDFYSEAAGNKQCKDFKGERNNAHLAENGIASNCNNVNLNDESGKNKNDFDAKNKLENINISSINPMPAQNALSHKRKSIKINKPHGNQHPQQSGKNFLMRNDSFSLPRTNSKVFSSTKNKK
jgi:hypothetical protein